MRDIQVKSSKKTYVILIAAVLVLAIACTTLGVVAFAIDNVAFDYDVTLDRTPYEYSTELTISYNSAMSRVLGNASLLLEDLSQLKHNIWLAFSRARISERTLLAFIEEVNSYDWESDTSSVAQFGSKFFNLAEDDSNKIVSAVTADDMLEAILATFLFLDRIGATADEIGRFSYHLVYLYADAEHRGLMDSAGEDNWTMLTVGTYTAGQLATNTDVYSSLTSARAVGQALTSLGHAYSEIADSVGRDNLSTLLGIDNLSRIDESNLDSSRLSEYHNCVDWMGEHFNNVFMLTADVLRVQETLLYEELYLYQAKLDRGEDSDTHLVYAMYTLAKGIKTALNRLKDNGGLSSDQETIAYLADYYASCATFSDIIYGEDNSTLTEYKTIAEGELARINADVNTLYSQEFESFYQVKKCKLETPELFGSLQSAATRLLTTRYDYESILTRFVYSVSIASIVALI